MAAMLHFTSGRDGFDVFAPPSNDGSGGGDDGGSGGAAAAAAAPPAAAATCRFAVFWFTSGAVSLERKGEYPVAMQEVRLPALIDSLPEDGARLMLFTFAAAGGVICPVSVSWLPGRAPWKQRMLASGSSSEVLRECKAVLRSWCPRSAIVRVHAEDAAGLSIADLRDAAAVNGGDA